jgi:predicted secreted Zn-dependent protease
LAFYPKDKTMLSLFEGMCLKNRFVSALLFAGVFMIGTSEGVFETQARTTSKTVTTYYSVSGKSAAGLYRQMISRGPHVSGSRAFAATSARQSYRGDFSRRKGRCRIRKFRILMRFKISLPRLTSKRGLSRATWRQWMQFSKFVKRHENRHRTIWLGCARRADRAVAKISAASCSAAEKRVEKIFRVIARRCDKLHDAFDKSEQRRIARIPLVVAAKRPQRPARKRGAAPTRRRTRANAERLLTR